MMTMRCFDAADEIGWCRWVVVMCSDTITPISIYTRHDILETNLVALEKTDVPKELSAMKTWRSEE
jgi:hypothetical protein